MRKQIGWLMCLLTAAMALTPARLFGEEPRDEGLALSVVEALTLPPRLARGQLGDAPSEDPIFPVPLGRADTSGPFAVAEILFLRQTNPLHNQVIAVRGVEDHDESITGVTGGFLGTMHPALLATDVGPGTYALGYRVTGGWHFRDNVEVEFNWVHMFDTKLSASAGPLPLHGVNPPGLLADSFLTSFVFNFPPDFAGPAQKVNLGNPGATFGIWDASTTQAIELIQRFDQYEISARFPLFGDDSNRTFWTIGPRLAWLWERFKWRVVAMDVNTGQAGQDDVAIYSNVLSQRLWGAHIGGGYEWFKGNTPIGGCAISLEWEAALFADVAKEIVKYERGDFAIQNKRSRRDISFVPELSGRVNLTWYPVQSVEIQLGYDLMAFFNTIASPDPVSFNFGGLDPPFVKGTTRIFDGFKFAIGLKF